MLDCSDVEQTVSTMSCFFLAMMVFPDVQRKAQKEIDAVVGPNRLPTVDDRDRLPYVNAIVKEALRWHPVTPIGLPHVATEDDIYEGYLIPKDAVIMPMIWGFMHDPKLFNDPSTFKPERFLGERPEMDPHELAFGFGRRICPGRILADISVWLTIAQSLAVFNIAKPVENGFVVEPTIEFLPGTISHPGPYSIDIAPRSERHKELVESVAGLHPWQESDARNLKDLA